LEQQIKAKDPLTVIIPIIIYHGTSEWQVRQFWEYFEGVDDILKAFIPNFQYQLTDLSRYSDEELIERGIGKLLNVFLAMIHVRDVKYILENYETIFIFAKEKDLEDTRFGNFFHSIFVYLFKYIELNTAQMEQISTNIHEPLKKFTMSAYDLLIEKGVKQGIEQGINLGESKAIRQVVISLLSKFPNWSDAEIAEVANTTVDNVAMIRAEITKQN
jgi:Putative transposase, YhgA-like